MSILECQWVDVFETFEIRVAARDNRKPETIPIDVFGRLNESARRRRISDMSELVYYS